MSKIKLTKESIDRINEIAYDSSELDGLIDECQRKNMEYGRMVECWICRKISQLQNSAELHFLAFCINYGDGIPPLKQILLHPLCTKATAMAIYWLMDPTYYGLEDLESDDFYKRESIEFLLFIEDCIQSEMFLQGIIKFDPKKDTQERVLEIEDSKREIPNFMLIPTDGEEFDFEI